MILLIKKQIVAGFLQTAVGYNASDFDNVFIREAQEFDLKPLVCEEFYYDLLANKDEEAWKKLIDGGEYQYNGRTYYFQGLSGVLSYFAYARFIYKGNVVSTSHGFTIKKTPHSEPLSLEERKNFYFTYRADANVVFEEVKKFIERNITDYPSWNCDSKCAPKSSKDFKTRVIQ